MKKLFSIASAIMILFVAFSFMGCEFPKGPTDTWCQMEIKDKDKNGTGCYAAFLYTESQKTVADKSVGPGITILLWSTKAVTDTNSLFSGFQASNYIMKSFNGNQDFTDGNDDTETVSFDFSSAGWDLLYFGNADLREAANQRVLPQTPLPLEPGSKYTTVSETAEALKNFSWKDVVKQIVLGVL